ncbi:hypothetical protein SFUMM280S_05871 [Streptomyces fumanus]
MFQDDVSVGAAHPEPRHPHPPRTPRLRPLAFLGQQFHRARRPVHLRAGRVNMQRARQHPVPHRHDQFDDAGHPGGGLRMPDVRLQRAQPQRPFTTLPVRRQQGLRLDRVAQCRARAVCLHRVHVTRRQPGRRQCAPNHPLLGGAVGGGEAVGGAVLVDGAATYDRQDPVSQPFRVRQALHQQHAHALRPARAVRRRGEGLAAAVRGQAPLAEILHQRLGAGHHRHPAGERHRALPGPQCLDGQVEGDQRGRARRVDGHRGALEAEHVGHAARGHAGRRPGHEVAFEVAGGAGTVVLVHHAGEDADVPGPAGRSGRCRPVRTPPRTSPGAVAAAGPWPGPRAGRCRRRPRRSRPRHAGSRPGGRSWCRGGRGPGRRGGPGPSPGRWGRGRSPRRPPGPAPTGPPGRRHRPAGGRPCPR